MISLENTPNYAGVNIIGDIYDFRTLLESIRELVGAEGEHIGYDQVRARFLRFCDEVESAMTDDGKTVLRANGLKEIEGHGNVMTAVQENNVYFQIPVLWTEMLFISFVLNDLIELSAKNNKHYWDLVPATARQFQGVVADHLEETIGENKFRLLKSSLTPNFIGYYQNYAAHYIDYLTTELLKNEIEQRPSYISILARRVAIKDNYYIKAKRKIERAASLQKIAIRDVTLYEIDIDQIEW
ncbi:hypothetical protein QWT69_02965 [Sporosarcina oncorhynchi]|uniref:Uncharacterized protein n=1 Tax=Sporosarcina oncorhynchi TaxID=3056444 RepID=A0ABZ0L7K3_9BACL|nr:hypothetical protein [Sporosarcina sp. T2O-4]WOV88100.1 hypothetical protein QWT69_02965 [Sporosarcina sp. T2O-4]